MLLSGWEWNSAGCLEDCMRGISSSTDSRRTSIYAWPRHLLLVLPDWDHSVDSLLPLAPCRCKVTNRLASVQVWLGFFNTGRTDFPSKSPQKLRNRYHWNLQEVGCYSPTMLIWMHAEAQSQAVTPLRRQFVGQPLACLKDRQPPQRSLLKSSDTRNNDHGITARLSGVSIDAQV